MALRSEPAVASISGLNAENPNPKRTKKYVPFQLGEKLHSYICKNSQCNRTIRAYTGDGQCHLAIDKPLWILVQAITIFHTHLMPPSLHNRPRQRRQLQPVSLARTCSITTIYNIHNSSSSSINNIRYASCLLRLSSNTLPSGTFLGLCCHLSTFHPHNFFAYLLSTILFYCHNQTSI